MGNLPDENEIREWALVNLPSHYVLKSVKLTFGSDPPEIPPDAYNLRLKYPHVFGSNPPILPADFEITIEYENRIDEALRGSFDDIESYQNWAEPLMRKIRERWGPKALRIGFVEKTP